jgi:hypothetical protein
MVAPIISIIKIAAVILVNTPGMRNIPPTTSNRAIGSTNSGESPRPPKNLDWQRYFQALVFQPQ